MSASQVHSAKSGIRFYVALVSLLIASTAIPLAGRWMHASGSGSIPFLLPMVLTMIWTGYEGIRWQDRMGSLGRPMRRYILRLTVSMTIYAIVLVAVILIFQKPDPPTGALAFGLALLPALPIVAIFWTIARLLMETTDEYQRLLFTKDILIATGFTLSIATIWGFWENFDQVPHVRGFHISGLWFSLLFVAVMVRRLRTWKIG
jgi:hypothetical protein